MTKREFEQIKAALDTMDGVNVNNIRSISKTNVIYLLSKFLEEDVITKEEIKENDI